MTVLSCTGVTKAVEDQVVLDGVDLDVDEHEVVALVSASGRGKSTLPLCINLLEIVTGGVINLDGQDVTDPRVNPDQVRRRIGVVFQAYNLFPHMQCARQRGPRPSGRARDGQSRGRGKSSRSVAAGRSRGEGG